MNWIQNRSTRSNSESSTVLNGIAYSKKRGTFFLTGKRWPIIFEVRMDISPPAPMDQGHAGPDHRPRRGPFPAGTVPDIGTGR